MEKNKTAMQELWKYVVEDNTIPFEHYIKLRNKIYPLLQKEKEQIKQAFREAITISDDPFFKDEEAEQYFKETYENN